jgi:2-oxoglutarate ferredoxin oxidoreductase subunit beta
VVEAKDYRPRKANDWCKGCGNFGILSALRGALMELDLGPDDAVLVSGIGCSAKLPHFINAHGFHTIHGRALPVATGIRLANHGLHVIAVTGDGDGLGIGGAHFVHTVRRNPDITHILHNNGVYGLTTGQVAPTSARGFVTKTTPRGSTEEPLNPVELALACGTTFVARTFVGDIAHAREMFKEAIQHKGYALVDALQPCVTFNRVNTYEWYQKRVYRLDKEGHDPSDFQAACARAREWGDRIPVGVFLRTERPTLEDELVGLKKGPLAGRDISKVDISRAVREFD